MKTPTSSSTAGTTTPRSSSIPVPPPPPTTSTSPSPSPSTTTTPTTTRMAQPTRIILAPHAIKALRDLHRSFREVYGFSQLTTASVSAASGRGKGKDASKEEGGKRGKAPRDNEDEKEVVRIAEDIYRDLDVYLHPEIARPLPPGSAHAEALLSPQPVEPSPSPSPSPPFSSSSSSTRHPQVSESIPHSSLVRISTFISQNPHHHSRIFLTLDPTDYTLISLLAGGRTLLSPAEERLISQNPHVGDRYLPPNLSAAAAAASTSTGSTARAKPSTSANLRKSDEPGSGLGLGSIASDLRSLSSSREISAVVNVLFSVVGVGAAVFVVGRSSSGMGDVNALLLALLSAIVVAAAETYLYTAAFRRSSIIERQKVIDRELRQRGPTRNPDIVPGGDKYVEMELKRLEKRVGGKSGLDPAEAAAGAGAGAEIVLEEKGNTPGSTTARGGTGQEKEAEATSIGAPGSGRIRLRRKPLTSET